MNKGYKYGTPCTSLASRFLCKLKSIKCYVFKAIYCFSQMEWVSAKYILAVWFVRMCKTEKYVENLVTRFTYIHIYMYRFVRMEKSSAHFILSTEWKAECQDLDSVLMFLFLTFIVLFYFVLTCCFILRVCPCHVKFCLNFLCPISPDLIHLCLVSPVCIPRVLAGPDWVCPCLLVFARLFSPSVAALCFASSGNKKELCWTTPASCLLFLHLGPQYNPPQSWH